MKAIVTQKPGLAAVQEVPEPKMRPEYIKIKVKAVALNPTDWKHIDFISDKGAVIGCDIAGTVEEIGSEVKQQIKKGDRVWGVAHGGNLNNHESGGFGDYALLKDGVFAKLPESFSFEEGAAIGVGVGTVGQGMYQALQLPLPNGPKPDPSFPLLIYGGSSATGLIALQFAKLSGLQTITTASPHSFDLVKSYGADVVFDYNDPECAKKINEYTKNSLRYAFDCIGGGSSVQICADALSSSTANGELHYVNILNIKEFPRKDVKIDATLLYTALGEAFTKLGNDVPAIPQHYEYIKKWMAIADEFVVNGQIKPQPLQTGKGYDGILEGLDLMRHGKVSGKKLVYSL